MALKRKQKGVTLVEVMVVIAVIGIGTSIMLASMGNAKEQKRVETAAREVAAMFREAQSNALSGKMYFDSTSGTEVSVCGYAVTWNRFNLETLGFARRIKDAAGNCLTGWTGGNSSKVFSGIQIRNQNGATPLFWVFGYDLPHATVNKTSGIPTPFTANGNLGITITSKNDSSVVYTVCAYVNGKVSEHPGSVNCDTL